MLNYGRKDELSKGAIHKWIAPLFNIQIFLHEFG